MSSDVVKTNTQMGADAAKGFKQGGDEWLAGDKTVDSYEKWSKALWTGKPGGQKDTTGEGGDGSTGGHAKPGKAKPAKSDGSDSELQTWEKELQDQKLAANDFWSDNLASDKAFWISKLAILEAETGGTIAEISKRNGEIRAIRQKVFDDSKALAQQERTLALEDERAKTALAVKGADEQYRAVKDGIDMEIAAVRNAAREGEIGPIEAAQRLEDLNQQSVNAQLAHIAEVTAAKEAGLKADELIYAQDPQNLKITLDAETLLTINSQDEITAAVRKGAAERQKIEAQAAIEYERLWTQRISGVVKHFGDGVLGMMHGTMTFRGVMVNTAMAIESSMFNAIERMVTKWIVGEITKTAATSVGTGARKTYEATAHAQTAALDFMSTMKTVTNAAIKAAAGAYSAMSGIPIIGPELGAIAAAVTFTAVVGLGMLASAAGGYDIPSGINPLVQTHAEEMILPANIANPLRSLAANYNGSNDNDYSGGGDTHHHSWQVNAIDARGVQGFFDEHGDKLFKTINGKLRAGAALEWQ